ncbi:MAG: FtsX-like permease family protein [Verrucomicrobiales bacterium]|nr:FtsX-like permease family protein [Verrucomicrobiales bacterium]
MSLLRLTLASLTHYRGLNLAVLAGVALTSAILSGALVVGDSVKESLRRNGAARIAGTGPVLVGGERFFTTALTDRLSREPQAPQVIAPVLQLEGTVSVPGGSRRLNGVQIVGVTDAFWKLTEAGAAPEALAAKGADWFAVNDAAARRLGVKPGDRVIARMEKPGALSRDAPLSGESEQTVPLSGTIDAVVDAAHFGRYSLKAEQVSAATVFVPLEKLQLTVEKEGQANVLLADAAADRTAFAAAVERAWNLADAELHLAKVGPGEVLWQLSTARVFLDPGTVEKARDVAGPAVSDAVLTYLVNGIRVGDRLTPYSMVAATGHAANQLVPADLGPNEIVVTDWLAEDLALRNGDAIRLEYYVVDTGRKLREESSEFTVRAVVPMEHPQIDRSWTPEFPGVLEVDSMDEWEPGIPIDKERIRKKDDEYWEEYRATPKAFVALEPGRQLWSNRFGNTTSVRFPVSAITAEAFEKGLKERLTLADLGWTLRDLPAESAAAVADSFDFGQLFAAMSFFLIVAALILTGLVFVFGIEQRASQIGLMMALGFPARRVRRLFLAEAAALGIVGALLGLVGGWIYTRLALLGMSGAWQAAASGIEFVYHIRPASLAAAFAITVLMALGVVWFASRLVMRVQPGHLIAGGEAISPSTSQPGHSNRRSWSLWIGLTSLLAGLGCLLAPKVPGTMAEQGLFFGAGFLLTIAGVSACALGLRRLERPGRAVTSLAALGRQYSVRRKGRSLAVIGLMAAGVFMVTAINSFRLEGERGAERRGSGTGGFAYVGESTLPVYEDLNGDQGREKYGFPVFERDDYWWLVPFRVSDGDDASCLNLNRAQRPRLMGVNPAKLTETRAFTFMKSAGEPPHDGWDALKTPLEPVDGMPVYPGVIDMNTATYALKRGLGDVIIYESAGGQTFGVRLVGLLETSILQGTIIISEEAFVQEFPDAGGYRFFLLDADGPATATRVAEQLTRMLGDRGLEMIPAWQRLNEFNAVQNTYLSIFSTLGGLGLLLGTVGLAVVVGRNVLERRGQLGLMQAVGFTRRSLARMVLDEHWFLHVLGVLLGIAAAVVAVLPKLLSQSAALPYGLLIGINAAILIGGLVFCAVAARLVLRGPLIEALRSE